MVSFLGFLTLSYFTKLTVQYILQLTKVVEALIWLENTVGETWLS
jgi:hypothetical protein